MSSHRSSTHRRRASRLFGIPLPFLVLFMGFTGACDDGPTLPSAPQGREIGVVLNSVDVTLTLFPADSTGVTRTVALAPDGSPVSLAARNGVAAVPLGFVPALAVVDLDHGTVRHTVSLPDNSGATGVAFVNDSVVLVANPNLDSATPVNVRSGVAGPAIPVGRYPQGVVVSGNRVGILNAELGPDFSPTGPGTVTVLDRSTLAVVGTVQLSGVNPGDGVSGADGRVWVVNSGNFGAGNGSVSVVDLGEEAEVAHHTGFGEFPFSVALGPDGRLHVGSFGYGLAVWDPGTASFVRSPKAAVTPEGIPAVSGLAFDSEGRLYTLRPECGEPSVANRLGDDFEVEARVSTGTCPLEIVFTTAGG